MWIIYRYFGAEASVFVPFRSLRFWAEARPDELRSDWPHLKNRPLPGAETPGDTVMRLSQRSVFYLIMTLVRLKKHQAIALY